MTDTDQIPRSCLDSKISLSVIVPLYNEAENVQDLVDQIVRRLI